ncbi:SET domain-containing protein-lysine N-methyltransferase [Tardiphaga sp. 813_E8_N1_3]|uniref:SET domain-containing protein n=1 Tax=Tardiphaga sp. 813_E8_N1_3 TaxID=3240760 RepID=UPI003F29375E
MPASTSAKPYRIGRSKTGLGLFATQPIKKGVKIVQYFGPLLDSKNEKHDAIENKYLFQISKRWTVDGSIRKNVARYINHACKPNAESDVNATKKKIVIRSIKKIEPGEEINYDYGTEYFKEYLKPIGCKCDSCEKKRKKKRAEARAEKLKAKEKAERKALKKEEKAKAKRAKAKAKKAKSSGKAASGKAETTKAAAKKKTSAATKASKAKTGKTKSKGA